MYVDTRILYFVLLTTLLGGLYSVYELLTTFGLFTVFSMFTDVYNPANALLWYLCPFADFFFHSVLIFNAGAITALLLVRLFAPKDDNRFHFPVFALLASAESPDFFSRALFSPMSSQHLQTYYSLTIYFFLAFALCGLLAGLAYLFSISTAQETEKRSEYECGFAPFDSATRLPFDVHFYLVGILFLIFDVEVALLFPWVLALRTTGWFSFYLMLAFLAILSLGFLYEWKRGALIWPTRYSKKNLSLLSGLAGFTGGDTTAELFDILFHSPATMFVIVFILHRLALVFDRVQWSQSKYVPRKEVLAALWFTAAVVFFISLFYSYYLSLALAIVFFVSSYLETNPFWPARAYWWARVLLFSFPSRFEKYPYQALLRFWGLVLALCAAVTAVMVYYFYFYTTSSLKVPRYGPRLIREIIYSGSPLWLILYRRLCIYIPYITHKWLLPVDFLLTIPAITVLGVPFVAFAQLFDTAANFISPYEMLALLLVFWMVASTAASYVYGGTSFVIRGNLYQKQKGDPSVSENMRYLWVEPLFLLAFTALAGSLYLVDWDLVSSVVNALIISARMDAVDGFYALVARILSAPADILNLLHLGRMYLVSAAGVLLIKFWAELKVVFALLLRFKLLIVWLLLAIRGYYYAVYLHQDEVKSSYEKFIFVTSSLLYVYVMPFVNIFYLGMDFYIRVRAVVTPYFVKYKAPETKEQPAQITDSPKVESTETKASSVIAAVIAVDNSGAPTASDCQTALQNTTAAQERIWALMNEVASAEIFYEGLIPVVSMLIFIAFCLLMRFAQLVHRWLNRTPLPAYASAELVKKFAWAPKKAAIYPLLVVTKKAESLPAKIDGSCCLGTDIFGNPAEAIASLSAMLAEVEGKIAAAYVTIALLTFCCTLLLIANCVLSRLCQHHDQQLNGILTYGALTVIPPAAPASRKSSKAALLLGGVSSAELWLPTQAEFPLVAELLLFILICAVITKLSSDLGKEHNKRVLAFSSWKALSAGLFAIIFIYAYQFVFDSGSATVLSGYFATSRTITLLKLITLISAVFVLDASETFMRQHSRHLLEYPIMVALTTLFMLLLVSANHVMSTFLSLVGFSLGLYVLILYDANRRPSRESGLKYYYLSTLSSGFILYGVLLIYTLTGTGNFDELFLLFNAKIQFQENTLLRTALLLVLAGFFFKLSAFPGHLWAADVYEGSPAPVTAFFMLPVKIVVLGAFIRLFSIALAPLATYWLALLTVAVIISILWGAFASVQEKKIRRFLAYASINQMGFLLMGLTTDSDEGYQAALLYIAVYAVMTCAFLTIFLSARRQDGSELLYVSDFRTLASRNWLVGWSLAVVLFSMAGIPPLGGFFAKYLVLLHAFEKNLIVEVVVGLATSLISTYYYLRIIKILKFEQPDGAMPSAPCLTSRRQNQLFVAEALLWAFILFAPAILGLTYTLAFTQGPACMFF